MCTHSWLPLSHLPRMWGHSRYVGAWKEIKCKQEKITCQGGECSSGHQWVRTLILCLCRAGAAAPCCGCGAAPACTRSAHPPPVVLSFGCLEKGTTVACPCLILWSTNANSPLKSPFLHTHACFGLFGLLASTRAFQVISAAYKTLSVKSSLQLNSLTKSCASQVSGAKA